MPTAHFPHGPAERTRLGLVPWLVALAAAIVLGALGLVARKPAPSSPAAPQPAGGAAHSPEQAGAPAGPPASRRGP